MMPLERGRIAALAMMMVAVPLSSARADRREVYGVLAYEPGVSHYTLGTYGSGSATHAVGLGVAGAVYYGLTNSLHLGGRIHLSYSQNVQIANAVVSMPEGPPSQGDVYQDHRAIALGALLLYRVDTRAPLAPIVELEGGFAQQQYSRVTFIPTGATRSYPQSSRSTSGMYGGGALLFEYRLSARLVASVGVRAQMQRGGIVPWSIRIPLQVGGVW